MRIKTSITLPEEIVKEIDLRAGEAGNRSLFIERAVRHFLAQARRAERDSRERELLDRHADELNREADDALAYQARPR